MQNENVEPLVKKITKHFNSVTAEINPSRAFLSVGPTNCAGCAPWRQPGIQMQRLTCLTTWDSKWRWPHVLGESVQRYERLCMTGSKADTLLGQAHFAWWNSKDVRTNVCTWPGPLLIAASDWVIGWSWSCSGQTACGDPSRNSLDVFHEHGERDLVLSLWGLAASLMIMFPPFWNYCGTLYLLCVWYRENVYVLKSKRSSHSKLKGERGSMCQANWHASPSC